jgi:hypothetical protein
MKTKSILFCVFLSLIYIRCEDSISTVGIGIQPDGDKVSVFDTTLIIDSRTVKVDSIYAKTVNGLLGDFYDPSYGSIKAGYACQFYPSIGFGKTDSIIDNKIDSVRLDIYYIPFCGDTLAPMEVTVYPVIKELNKNYYTNVNPAEFCDMEHPLAKQAYTARNLSISDSLLAVTGYYLSIPLPTKLGQDYLEKVEKNELNSVQDFLNYFPGLYIANTFGTGSMLAVDYTIINMYYTRRVTVRNYDDTSDSIIHVSSAARLAVTQEVIQLNSFKNANDAFLLENSSDRTYLKSPAGVFTELTIPIRELAKRIGKKKFNSVKLTLNAYPADDDFKYALSFPGLGALSSTSSYTSKLLLIEPDSVKNFFEQQKVADNQTSYTTSFSSSTYAYDFTNIANVVQNAIDKAPDKDLQLWVVPVLTTFTSQQTYAGYVSYDYSTSHYLYPSGVALKKGGDNLKIRVIATDLEKNN